MNRERGASSLALILLLLVVGSLLLQGVNQQERSFAARVKTESQALQRQAVVQSAMEWGRVQSWQGQGVLQCRQYAVTGVSVCLRIFADNTALLITQYAGVSLWRLGEIAAGKVVFSPHGWSDFCPLTEAALCQIP